MAGNVIINHLQAPDDVFLDQSEHRNLYIHLCNISSNISPAPRGMMGCALRKQNILTS